MSHSPDGTSPAASIASRDTPTMAARRRLGHIISIIGIVLLVPLMVSAVLVEDYRGIFALSALASWVVWKTGRTMIKLNSPEDL
jgi:hypothetical protein